MGMFKPTLISAALLATGSMGAQAETVIDLFDTPQSTLSVCYIDTTIDPNVTACSDGGTAGQGGEESSRVSSAGGDIVGMERDLFIEATGSDIDPDTGIHIAGAESEISVTAGGGGVLSWSNDSGAESIATVQWDGVGDTNPEDLVFNLGLDLSGETQFVVDVRSSDLNFEFSINLYTDADTYTKITLLSDQVSPPGGPEPGLALTSWTTTAEFLCASFGNPVPTPPLGQGDFDQVVSVECGSDGVVDLANIGAIEAVFNTAGTAEVDLSIRSIIAVPVPSTLALFGGSLIAFGMMLGRRKAAL